MAKTSSSYHVKKSYYILGIISLAALTILGVLHVTKKHELKTLKIAFSGPWNNIHPGLQHTLTGDLVLSNQFESLVSFYENGTYGPMAAREWSQTPDFKKLIFKIDTSKKFSDGTNLSAQDFKNSWETALKLEPKSLNSSTLDVLYKVEGFKDFGKTGHLSGVHVVDKDTLEINFITPFRMALEHLSGNRFSAFKEVDGKFLGTGAFIIEELGPEHLVLTPNIHHSANYKNNIEVFMISTNEAIPALINEKIDVLAYGIGSSISNDIEKYEQLSILIGQEGLHRTIFMNSQSNRLFSNKEFRQALQYLVRKYYQNNISALGNKNFTTIDSQVFLPLQAGRLDLDTVENLVNEGAQYVHKLCKASIENPPILLSTEEFSIKPMLEASGIKISPQSKVVSKAELIAEIYKGEVDLLHVGFGVASGDPDGIYHLLGEKGAIKSPMVSNKYISDLLEQGRKIIDRNEIDPFYRKVSINILKEAPIAHIGFNKVVAIYRNDTVKVNGHFLRRNAGHLHIFEPK